VDCFFITFWTVQTSVTTSPATFPPEQQLLQ
jgi:hypothetical protein